MPRKSTGLILAAACLFGAVAGGCAGGKVTRIRDEQEFKQMVLESDRPVLVDFYKGGCATCVPLDGVMDQLVDEYQDRALIAKFETMTAFFGVPSPQIKHRYDIAFFPTAVLFVNGEVKKRWIMRYNLDNYRQELNKYVAPATPTEAPAAGGGTDVGAAPPMSDNKASLY